ncbi:MAG: hypothetical protein WBM83_06560 [Flavobacteriaceae bacterium]
MELDQTEKLALVNVIDSVIQADSIVHPGEIGTLSKLMDRFDFNGYFIEEARNLDVDQGLLTLNDMPYPKKKELAEILGEMSLADGSMHEKEIGLILDVLSTIGLGGELE